MPVRTQEKASAANAQVSAPQTPARMPASPTIVLDMGSTSRKKIRKLKKKGAGPLVDEAHAAIEETRQQLGGAADGTTLVPVVLLYRKKRSKKSIALPPLLFG